MKTLKLSALALGMVCVGSVIAMDAEKANLREPIAPLSKADKAALAAKNAKKRMSGSDMKVKRSEEAIAPVGRLSRDELKNYQGSKRGDRSVDFEGFVPLAEPVKPGDLPKKPAAPKAESLLTKLKSLHATCWHQITARPLISAGALVVVIAAVAVYVVNKRAAQEAEIRNIENEDGDIVA